MIIPSKQVRHVCVHVCCGRISYATRIRRGCVCRMRRANVRLLHRARAAVRAAHSNVAPARHKPRMVAVYLRRKLFTRYRHVPTAMKDAYARAHPRGDPGVKFMPSCSTE